MPGLTPRRIILILLYAYEITKENRALMIKGFFTSVLWALVGALFAYPMSYLIDSTTTKVPYEVFMPEAIKQMIVIYGLHNIVLPYILNNQRTRLLIAVKKTLSVNAVVNLEAIDSSTLKKLIVVAGPNLQAWLQASREEIGNLIITVVFDAPMYLRGLGMVLFFLYKSSEAPRFAIVAIGGLLIYGAITIMIGIKLGRLFREKQAAFMELQGEEQQVFNDLLRSRNMFSIVRMLQRKSPVDTDQFAEVWKDFEKKFTSTEVRLLRYNMLVRDAVLEVTKLAALAVALWYGSTNAISYGMAFFLRDQIDKAADPFVLFGPLQKMLLNAEIFIESHHAIS